MTTANINEPLPGLGGGSWPLLALPKEARIRIYEIYFTDERYNYHEVIYAAILNVSRQVRTEALPAYWAAKGCKTFYSLETFLSWCVKGNQSHLALVKEMKLIFDELSWEGFCGWSPVSAPICASFKSASCSIPLKPHEEWDRHHQKLVDDNLPRRSTAWRWPSMPLDWNTQPFPPDNEIEDMYVARLAEATSARESRESPPQHHTSAIQLIWSCISCLIGLERLTLDFGVGYCYNWKFGRKGAGYRIPNFTPEHLLLHDMFATAAATSLRYLDTTSNQAHVLPLTSLGGFSGLQELRLASCTGSSPEELCEILSSLPSLRKLQVVSNFDKAPMGSTISVTADVVRAVGQLTSISFVDDLSPGYPSCIDAAIVEALAAHEGSLQGLKIMQDRGDSIMDITVFEALLRVLPRLTHLNYAYVAIRVRNGVLRERGYIPAELYDRGEYFRFWDMAEYLPPSMPSVVEENKGASICIRDEKRKPTGGYLDKYCYFEG